MRLIARQRYRSVLGTILAVAALLTANRPADGQLVASLHSYRGQRCSAAACWNSEIAAVAAQVPVVIGEFGAGSTDADVNAGYLESLMDWADGHGVGYLAWAWWVLPDPSPTALALLDNDNGTPRSRASGSSEIATVLNYPAAQSTGTGLILPIQPGRADSLTLVNAAGPTQVAVDVLGYFG